MNNGEEKDKTTLDALKNKGNTNPLESEDTIEQVIPDESPAQTEEESPGHDTNVNAMDVIMAQTKKVSEETEKLEEESRQMQSAEALDVDDDDLSSLIEEIEAEGELGVTKEEVDDSDRLDQLQLMLEKLDEIPTVDIIGAVEDTKVVYPNGYIKHVESERFTGDIEALAEGNLKATNASRQTKVRSLAVKRFINRGNCAEIPLPNTGIKMTISGSSITEVINMMSKRHNSSGLSIMYRVNEVLKQTVDTTVGPLNLKNALKIFSNHDLETLYYGLFVSTFPDVNQFPVTCQHCEKNYRVSVHNRDLLLNAEDFHEDVVAIEEADTVADLLKSSRMNQSKQVILEEEGVVIMLSHPSIQVFVTLLEKIGNKMTESLQGNLISLYHIESLKYVDSMVGAIEYTAPLSEEGIKDVDTILSNLSLASRDILNDAIQDMIPAIPLYGIKESMCPACNQKNDQRNISMASMLFSQARDQKDLNDLNHEIQLLTKKKNQE